MKVKAGFTPGIFNESDSSDSEEDESNPSLVIADSIAESSKKSKEQK